MDDAHHPGRSCHAAELFFEWATPRLSARYRRMIAALLRSTDWDDYGPRLLRYAAWRLERTSRYRSTHVLSTDDCVQEAIALIAAGERHYYRTRRKPWFDFIAGVIDSLTSGDHLKKEDHIRHLAVTTATDTRRPVGTCGEWQLPATPASQEDIVEEIVAERKFRVFADLLPPKVREYAELRRSEMFVTAAEYAEAMHTTEADVRNRHKLLKRRRALWRHLST